MWDDRYFSCGLGVFRVSGFVRLFDPCTGKSCSISLSDYLATDTSGQDVLFRKIKLASCMCVETCVINCIKEEAHRHRVRLTPHLKVVNRQTYTGACAPLVKEPLQKKLTKERTRSTLQKKDLKNLSKDKTRKTLQNKGSPDLVCGGHRMHW